MHPTLYLQRFNVYMSMRISALRSIGTMCSVTSNIYMCRVNCSMQNLEIVRAPHG
eukprot:m.863006 g.863006  ORF g.863006 m.863006 type:complete len:55 (+) comp23539_c0_seq5:2038-2202(+)